MDATMLAIVSSPFLYWFVIKPFRMTAATESTKFSNLLEAAPEGIIGVAEDGRIRFVNAQAETLFGYSREQLLGQPVESLIPQRLVEGHVKKRETYLRAPRTRPMGAGAELYGRKKDGTEFPVDVSLSYVETQEGPLVLSIVRDITDRKQVEQTLRDAKEAAEVANVAKSTFLANMSHEIRTPMNGIMGMMELVLDTELDSEQREYLNMAKLSADSLLSLINDILDYSKIEARKLEIEAIEFNLGDNLGDTLKALSLRAHQKGLELAYDLQPDVPDALVGDPGRLRQIIVNLAGNAIKFTEKGEVVVHVQADSRTDDDIELHFTIVDTGIGIPAEKQSAIFEAFTQADGSMSRTYGGTGLGLTISSRLAGFMRGRIWVESEVGMGSRFHFTARFWVTEATGKNHCAQGFQDFA
ncbi:MAG TPA: ATP-binding protein [Candidatus Acidoferrum sp.]|nr:ATP-binding protein [Candidatus Acidoferrum sp.]